jgi:outer membrane receptor for ferrienterochelin and colicins
VFHATLLEPIANVHFFMFEPFSTKEIEMSWKSMSILVGTVLLMVALANDCWSQKGAVGIIEGNVTDGNSGQPLPLANIVLQGTNLGAATDLQGSFFILDVPPGNYQMRATMMGYKSITRRVQVRASQTVRVNFRLVETPIPMDAIVVTGTRTPRTIKDVPVRTELISARMIEEKGAVQLYEALEAEPGVRVEQQCSNCNFSILRVEGLEGGYAQVLIDGQPIFSGLAGVYGLQQMQTGHVKQIEVVKGAGSALYGSDAIGGVVNVVMKDPSSQPALSLGMSLGTHATNSFNVEGSLRNDKLGLIFSAQKDMADAIDQTGGDQAPYDDIGGDNYTDRVETDDFGAGVKLHWYNPLGSGSRLKVHGRTISEFRRGGNLDTWDDPFDPDSEQIRTTRYETGLGLEKTFPRGNRLELNVSFVHHDRNATNGAAWDKPIEAGMLDDELNLTPQGQAYVDEYGFEQFRAEWYPQPFILNERLFLVDVAHAYPLGKHTILAGAQYRRSDLKQDINRSQSDKCADDLGFFLQADLVARPTLELILGARYDRHSSQDDLTGGQYDETAINPRLALKYSVSSDLSIRANLGTGFRVPYIFSEDLHLCASAPRIYKGPDLVAEKALSMSVGGDFYQADYRLGFNVFRTQIRDKFEFVSADDEPIPAGYDYQWANVGDAYTQGAELTLGGTLLLGLEAKMDVVYTDARFEEPRYDQENYPGPDDGWKHSDRIPRSPAWTGSAQLTYRPGSWVFLINGSYTGSMYIDHTPEDDPERLVIEKTDPFAIFSMKVSRRVVRGLELFAGAKNLFDYTQPKRDNSNAAYIWAPLTGRIFYVGFELNI